MIRHTAAFALLLLLFTLLPLYPAQDGRMSSSREGFILTDGLNREVMIDSTPQRIVLAGRANLFLVNALYLFESASDRVAALAETDQGMGDFFPFLDPRWEEKIRLDNSAGAEEILARNPDLVIIKDSMYERIGTQLESFRLPVLTLALETYGQYLQDITLLGEVLEEEDRAEFLTEYITLIVESIEQTASESSSSPRVLMLYHTSREGAEIFHIPPADWIQTFMVETAGGEALWKEAHASGGWQAVHFEQIARWNPDMIFLISYNKPSPLVLEYINKSARWSKLDAYQQGNILAFPGDYHSWAQSDIRWLLGLQWLAQQLHPEEFSHIDMEQAVLDFYTDLYSLSEQTIRGEILPRVKGELSGRNE